MNEFEKALEQVRNGEKVTGYGCETSEEKHLLALVNKTGYKGFTYPLSKKEELLQLLAVVIQRDDININKLLINLLAANEDLSYSNVNDDTLAYQKVNPANVLPYAHINMVGGMSYKSENLLVLEDAEETTKNGITHSVTNGVVTINGKHTTPYTSIISQSIYNLLEDGKTYTLRCKETTVNPNMFAQINIVKNDDSREYYSLNSKNSMQFTVDKSLYKDAIFIIQSGKELVEVNNLTITPEIVLGNGITHSKVTSINELVISNEVLNLNGYGLGINSDCYNYIDFKNKKYVQKVCTKVYNKSDVMFEKEYDNVVYYGVAKPTNFSGYGAYDKEALFISSKFNNKLSETWDDSLNINAIAKTADEYSFWIGFTKGTTLEEAQAAIDGLEIVYELEEPIEIDISHYIDNGYIKVSEGGSIVFENEHKNKVPSSVTYQTKIV